MIIPFFLLYKPLKPISNACGMMLSTWRFFPEGIHILPKGLLPTTLTHLLVFILSHQQSQLCRAWEQAIWMPLDQRIPISMCKYITGPYTYVPSFSLWICPHLLSLFLHNSLNIVTSSIMHWLGMLTLCSQFNPYLSHWWPLTCHMSRETPLSALSATLSPFGTSGKMEHFSSPHP